MKYEMKSLKVSDIHVGERFRKDYGNLEELKESIQEKGVLQPICVDQDYNLLAGGRRFQAVSELGMPNIPALIRKSDGEIDAREVELIENVHRKEMSWQEQAALTAKIHALYLEKDPKWTQRKTAELINSSPMSINRALKLDSSLKSNPDLGKSKTADEALQTVKKAEIALLTEELAKRQRAKIQRSGTSVNPCAATLKRADLDYEICDVFTGMHHLIAQKKTYPLIECDPPFGLPVISEEKREKNSLGDKGAGVATFQDVLPEHYPAFLEKLAADTYTLGASDSWMLFWFAFTWYGECKKALEKAGWSVDPVPALWLKGKVPFQPFPDKLLNSYHPFFVCKKGSPHLMHERHSNVFFWTGENEKHYHPHQRPLQMIQDLLKTFAPPSAKVLVPFLGSGMTLRACYLEGYYGHGFEIDPQYKDSFFLAVEEDFRKMQEKEKSESANEGI